MTTLPAIPNTYRDRDILTFKNAKGIETANNSLEQMQRVMMVGLDMVKKSKHKLNYATTIKEVKN